MLLVLLLLAVFMPFNTGFFIAIFTGLCTAAALSVDLAGIQADIKGILDTRQIIAADPSIACCTNCGEKYNYDTFWNVFNDFCDWAGNGMELWTSQTYYSGSYYCAAGDPTCIHLMVQYLCGDGNAYPLDYGGCMGYLTYSITPTNVCGGPPYPGARVESADKCWIFQATADSPASAVSRIELECDNTGRWCHMPGSNETLPVPLHEFTLVSHA